MMGFKVRLGRLIDKIVKIFFFCKKLIKRDLFASLWVDFFRARVP